MKFEPGDRLNIQYGRNRIIEVVVLDLWSQMELADEVSAIANLEKESKNDTLSALQMFRRARDVLRLCLPDDVEITKEFLRDKSIDAENALEIATKCLAKNRMDADEEKKSE